MADPPLAQHRTRAMVTSVAIFALGLSAFFFAFTSCRVQPNQADLVRPRNTNADVNGVLIRDLFVVPSADGSSGALVGVFLNQRTNPASLLGVSVTDAGGTATADPGLALPPATAVAVGSFGQSQIVLSGSGGSVFTTGDFVPIALTFTDSASLTVEVLVRQGPS